MKVPVTFVKKPRSKPKVDKCLWCIHNLLGNIRNLNEVMNLKIACGGVQYKENTVAVLH